MRGLEDPDSDAPTRTKVVEDRSTRHRRLGRLLAVVVDGPNKGKKHHVEVSRGRTVKGGRGSANDLVIRDDRVSMTHFELVVQDDGIVLRDLGSTNGVWIHGVRVREAVLDVDAVFRVGDTGIQITGTDTISVSLSDHDHFGELYGDSPIMREVFADLERVATLAERLPVLVTGETGTGKELVARGLHDASPRRSGPFVVLDCTALPRELAESLILGHARGAFTGAIREHPGIFEQAHGGTLFIDELGELPLELQAKLLRPLERGEVVRIADASVRKVDVRVIAATHRDLRLMMSQGKFREDLYFRLAFKVIEIPSLRDRGEDVVLLARRFLRATCKRDRLPPKDFSPDASAGLQKAAWPGNVRQLKATVECAALISTRMVLEPSDLRLDDASDGPNSPLDLGWALRLPVGQAKEEFERIYYKALIKRVGTERGWIVRAAKISGLDRTGLIKALKRLGLYPEPLEEVLDAPE